MNKKQLAKINAGVKKRYMQFNFDNYITETEEQSEAKIKCLNFCNQLKSGNHDKNLLIVGTVGTGKTMLGACIVDELIFHPDFETIQMIKAADLFDNIRNSFSDNSQKTADVIRDYAKPSLLIIDELGVQNFSDTEKQSLTRIIDARYDDMKPTVIITNMNVKAITERIGERVVDRLRSGGELIKLTGESKRK